MQVIKNIKAVVPTSEQLEAFANSDGVVPVFFQSEDKLDWYECHGLFSDETVKIMYDSDGIIRSVVDKPIPERGNIYAVSMFYPDGMSVAEVALNEYPEGVTIDGTWMFDGEKVIPVPIDYVSLAEKHKNLLLTEAETAIAPLQRAVKLGIATEGETMLLERWEVYSVMLSRVDTSLAPDIEWPLNPL